MKYLIIKTTMWDLGKHGIVVECLDIPNPGDVAAWHRDQDGEKIMIVRATSDGFERAESWTGKSAIESWLTDPDTQIEWVEL